MSLGLSVAADIIYAALDFHIRGDALSQTTQDKPLLRELRAKQTLFPGGKGAITTPIQGAYMSDSSSFIQGYTEDEALTFAQAANLLRATYNWKEISAGLIITETELKKDGITLNHGNPRENSRVDQIRLTGILKNRLNDFTESWARATNRMLWQDGTQDSEQVAGIKSILTDVAAVGTTGGLNRATYAWWRHRVFVGSDKITASPSAQTLTKFLRQEARLLTRYGGKPDLWLAGSAFIAALESEVAEKGIYTQSGFTGKQNIAMGSIAINGLGVVEYDPTLDDMGESDRCYAIDTKRIKLMPMEGCDNTLRKPEQPYQYLVFLQNMLWTGALVASQLNSSGVYQVTTP